METGDEPAGDEALEATAPEEASEEPTVDDATATAVSTVIYVRDTTATPSGSEQRERTLEYATHRLGLDPEEVVVLSDTALHGRTAQASSDQELFDLASDGEIERVIVDDAARIATDVGDLHERLTRLFDDGVAVHVVASDLRLGESGEVAASDSSDEVEDIDDGAMLRALEVAAELEASVSSERTREGIAMAQAEGKHVGRPPFGFDSDGDGHLVPNENFETALAVIEQIESGESKRQTAREAGITRATVRNIVDREELYRSV